MFEKTEIVFSTKNKREMFRTEKASLSNVSIRGWIYNWTHRDGKETVIMLIRKGYRAGGHYHKGQDPSKKPERFFVAKGKAKVLFATEEGTLEMKEKIVEEGEILTIPPKMGHLVKALEDLILIEHRETPFDPERSDTYDSNSLAK